MAIAQTRFITRKAVAFECLRCLVNEIKEGEFVGFSALTSSTTILGRDYSLDSIHHDFIDIFSRKVATELIADIRATGLREFVELPLPELGDFELVTDKHSRA